MLKKDNKEIKITREEFVKKFMVAIADPFKGANDNGIEDKARLQISIMMVGMLLCKRVEEELFGKEE